MKNTSQFLLLFVMMISLFSCDQKEKSNESPTTELQDSLVTEYKKTSEDELFANHPNAKKMKEIEERIDPNNRVESLYWEKQTKNGSQFTKVAAFINDDGQPMKITEYFIDGNFQPQGQRHYFLEDNNMIAFKEQKDTWIDSLNTMYTEKRTIYQDNAPVLTQVRSAKSYIEIEEKKWKDIGLEHHSIEKVNNILSGEGQFQTHFISVIKTDQLYLLLGEAKPKTEERYTTAVRVDEMTPFIEDLLQNLDEYKFRPVYIQFTVVGGNNTPEYRVLTDIKWKEKVKI
ncbi:hypothetical protein [Brumimicrobium aurantiacum]|uniref:Lipoprotein n=1 Tax=Brumimicrobium aurantiacum TaxID=1737063 RepID=A0A3E1EXS3_9FLAO|nr:hypothetical protein [Brumimicrobium aurantiacum]RFC54356.1 hypothetical protein DXU93_07980 [Brumimicrobium aurantiacum]